MRLSILVFFTGFFSIIVQTIILREFYIVISGNEFFLGIILANWLLGIFFGAIVSGKIKKNNSELYPASIILMSSLLPVLIVLTRILYLISGTAQGQLIAIQDLMMYSLLIIFPFSFLIGFQFPKAVGIYTRKKKKFRSAILLSVSVVYICESAGSFFAGVVYTFIFAGRVSNFRTASFISILLLLALIFYLSEKKSCKFRTAFIIICLISILIQIQIMDKIDKDSTLNRWEGISNGKLLLSVDTKYQNVSISCEPGQNDLYLNGRYSFSFPDDDTSLITAANLFVQSKNTSSALIVGSVDFQLMRELKKFGFRKIRFCQPDKQFVDIMIGFDKMILKSNDNIVSSDIRDLIADSRSKWDLIYINSGEPSSLSANRNFTLEFFHGIRKILKKNGTVALRVTSTNNYLDGFFNYYTAIIFKTFEKSFPYMIFSVSKHSFLFGSFTEGVLSDNYKILSERYSVAGVKPGKLKFIFRHEYDPGLIKKKKIFLNSYNKSVLNSDIMPVGVPAYIQLESNYRSNDLKIYGTDFSVMIFMTFILIPLVFLLIFQIRKSKRKREKISVKTVFGFTLLNSGITSMSVFIIVIYAFQILKGYLYSNIGFLIALFMSGLPLGATLITSWLKKEKFILKDGRGRIFYALHILASALVIIIALIMKFGMFSGFLAEISLYVIILIAGMLSAAVFTLSVSFFTSDGKNPEIVAGFADGIDHLGGFTGAIITGMLLFPLFGLWITSAFLLLLQVVSVSFFFTFCWKDKLKL